MFSTRSALRSSIFSLFIACSWTAPARAEVAPTTEPIRGRVVDADGNGLSGVRVYGWAKDVEQRMVLTQDDGTFEIPGLAEHPWSLGFNKGGYVGASLGRAAAGPNGVSIVLQLASRLSGRLTSDDGRPVERLDFALFPNDAKLVGQRERPERVQRTDGGFVASGLKPGRFRLLVNARGYLPLTIEDVELASGATTALNLHFSTGSSLNGRVVEVNGEPVAKANVSWRAESTSMADYLEPWTRTNARGDFTLAGLPTGTIDLYVTHDERAKQLVADVRVSPGEPIELPTIVLSSGAAVHGVVRDARGAPVLRARLSLYIRGEYSEHVWTEADGRFVFPNLRPAIYELTCYWPSGALRRTEVTVGERSRIRFSLPRTTVRGIVLENRSPVPHAAVLFTHAGNRYRPRSLASARADAAGRYELSGVEPGRHHVFVAATAPSWVDDAGEEGVGLLGFNPMRFPGSDGVQRIGEVEVPPVDVFDHDVELSGVMLRGVVVDGDSGDPVAEARVYAYGDRDPNAQANARSGSDGTFQLRLPRAGEWRIRADSRDHPMQGITVEVATHPGDPVTVVLERGWVLRATVTDELGQRVHPCKILLSWGWRDDWKGGRCEPDGTIKVKMTDDKPVILSVFADGKAQARRYVDAPSEQPLSVQLTPGGGLTLSLDPTWDAETSHRGTPPGASPRVGWIYLRDDIGRFREIPLRADMRYFTFDHIAPGRYTVEVMVEDRVASTRFTIVEGETTHTLLPPP